MQITLINCLTKLQAQGVNLSLGSGVDILTSRFNGMLPLQDWNYNYESDSMIISVPDGTTIPANLSNYGDVVLS